MAMGLINELSRSSGKKKIHGKKVILPSDMNGWEEIRWMSIEKVLEGMKENSAYLASIFL